MSNPKFAWEPLDGGSLLLKVSDGPRETTWKLGKRTTLDQAYQIFWEIQSTMDEMRYERIPGINAHPTEAEYRVMYAPEKPVEGIPAFDLAYSTPEQFQETEEDSRAALAAKVASIQGNWLDQLDDLDPDDLEYAVFLKTGYDPEESA